MKIGIVTCIQHCHMGRSREPDDQLVLDALGGEAQTVVWDNPQEDWSRYDQVIVRSTWDYHHRRDAFLSWARAVAHITSLRNSYETISWNTHKEYLRELELRGVPIVPTLWLPAASNVDLKSCLSSVGWENAVVKPAIGTNSYGAMLVSRGSLAKVQPTFSAFVSEREMMLQPFFPSINSYGERSLVFIADEFTHAFRKRPAFGGEQGAEEPVLPASDEVSLAKQIVAKAKECIAADGMLDFLFARVDLVRDDKGEPRLMELELTEPRLRLDLSSEALGRLVQMIRDHCLVASPICANHAASPEVQRT